NDIRWWALCARHRQTCRSGPARRRPHARLQLCLPPLLRLRPEMVVPARAARELADGCRRSGRTTVECAREGTVKSIFCLICALGLVALVPARPLGAGGSCRDLAKLVLPNATITQAEDDASGGFCRVAATLRPSKDSDIKIEVWLPASGWNGKLLAVGN